MAGAAILLGGVQAMAQGVSALADREQTELYAQWQQEDMTHRQLERAWRDQDLNFRRLEKEWRRVDNKRRRVEEKTQQVALLARLSALMGGFQVAMFINQGFPSLSDRWPLPLSPHPNMSALNGTLGALNASLGGMSNVTVGGGGLELGEVDGGSVWDGNPLLSPVLLGVWSAVCAGVIVLNFSVMVVASLIQLSIVHATGNEGVGGFVPEDQQYALDGTRPDGIIVHEEQFLAMWQARYDYRFKQLMSLFSYGVPLYFLSLGLGVLIKFYMSPVAAWLSFSVTVIFMGVWWKYHSGQMTYLTHRTKEDEEPKKSHSKREGAARERSQSPGHQGVPRGEVRMRVRPPS